MKKYICIYSGSTKGQNAQFQQEALALGKLIAKNNFGLVYGGATIGLMGIVADGVLELGGEIIGVMPQFLLDIEGKHAELSKFELVHSVHERKYRMAELSDIMVALPGGVGTLDEIFDLWSRLKLNELQKPLFVLNSDHFYDPLIAMVDNMLQQGFIEERHRELVYFYEDAEQLMCGVKKALTVDNAK